MPQGGREFTLFPFRLFRLNPPFLDNAVLPGPIEEIYPWRRREAWRSDPFFSRANRMRASVPGLLLASIAFAAFVAYDQWDQASGPASIERKKWEEWMHEREKRIAAEEGHHGGHH
ncbi:hypothetical protein BJ742DRAFT_678835 [Cladochytrium replicatum]|nr:hypothetical protein BJ742DRAFT_678835 [Cladochytrium replicatum]